MKKTLLTILAFVLSISACWAEKIYYKSGAIVNAQARYLKEGVFWISTPSGLVGIALANIAKIENDDGSISKFDFNSLFQQSQICLQQGNFAQAVKYFTALLESFPKDAQLHYLRGSLYYKLGDLDGAMKDYLFLADNNSADADVYNNLGVIFIKKGRKDEAVKWLNKAIKAGFTIPEIHNNLAELYLETGQYRLAAKEYDNVISMQPANAVALYNAGIAYMKQGDTVTAEHRWKKALAVAPQDELARNSLEYLTKKKQ